MDFGSDAAIGPPRRIVFFTVIVGLTVLTLAFDLSQPLGVAAGVKYILIVLAGLLTHSVATVWMLAALASLLTVIGYHLSPTGIEPDIVITNRILTFSLIWTVAIAVTSAQLHRRRLKELSQLDFLTGAHNRSFLSFGLRQLVERWGPDTKPLSLILIDIDHFKKINDRYGHLAGDHVLQIVAGICQQEIRQNDLFCRYGGEEFVVVLPGTDLDAARTIADRLRQKIENTVIDFERFTFSITASFGVTKMTPAIRNYSDLFNAADEALYEAKSAGRNRVMVNVRKKP